MKVIFACVHNAGRSQMAAAFFNQYADSAKAQAISAGTQPADNVHDNVISVMQKIGINLANTKPQLLTEKLAKQANLLVTMGCGEACPYIPELKREDSPFTDPKGKSEAEVLQIRDEIKMRVMKLLGELNALNGSLIK